MPISRPFFYTAFGLLFVVGALLAHVGLPFRLAMVPILCLPLTVFRGLAITRTLVAIIVFGTIVLVSAAVNHSTGVEALLFGRLLVTPYVMYYLARAYVTGTRVQRVLQLAIAIGLLQLPVTVIQRLGYDVLSPLSRHGEIPRVDFVSGTFFISDDPAMSLFLLSLVGLDLLGPRPLVRGWKRSVCLTVFSLSILIANSMLSHLLLFGVWTVAAVRRLEPIALVRITVLASIAGIVFVGLGWAETWIEEMSLVLRQVTMAETAHFDRFLAGDYSRVAAVQHYLTSPLSWLGDGPSSSYDPVTQTRFLGNTGHHLLMYGEVGLLGLLASLSVLAAMAWDFSDRMNAEYSVLLFTLMVGLGVTTSVMSDASIVFTYCMFLALSRHLQPRRQA